MSIRITEADLTPEAIEMLVVRVLKFIHELEVVSPLDRKFIDAHERIDSARAWIGEGDLDCNCDALLDLARAIRDASGQEEAIQDAREIQKTIRGRAV